MDYDREMEARRAGDFPLRGQEAEDHLDAPADDDSYPEGWEADGWPHEDEAVLDDADFDHATGEALGTAGIPADSWFTVGGVYCASMTDADRARQLLAEREARDAARFARYEAAQRAARTPRRAA